MFCKRVTVNLKKKSDIFHLRPLGDVHLGNIGCDVDKFKKNVQFIAQHDNYYTVGMGDFIDNVQAYAGGQVDKRWNPETVDRAHMTSEEQIDYFLELFEPIKDKTWGLLAGNHEWKTINQRAFITQMCRPLNLPYLGRLAYIYLDCKYEGISIHKYLILVLHGGYGGMQAGGGVNRMKAIGGDFDADLILMGHSHDTWTRTGVRIAYDAKHNEAYERKIIYANTGTFLRGYAKGVDSYVEINPREAKRVGTVTITFDPFNRDMFAHD